MPAQAALARAAPHPLRCHLGLLARPANIWRAAGFSAVGQPVLLNLNGRGRISTALLSRVFERLALFTSRHPPHQREPAGLVTTLCSRFDTRKVRDRAESDACPESIASQAQRATLFEARPSLTLAARESEHDWRRREKRLLTSSAPSSTWGPASFAGRAQAADQSSTSSKACAQIVRLDLSDTILFRRATTVSAPRDILTA